jgi:hypothetical protein
MKFNDNFKSMASNMEMHTTIGIDPEHGGWYETYDENTGGERFYAEGELEVDFEPNGGVSLTGYDGCFELPAHIIEALEKKGVNIDL